MIKGFLGAGNVYSLATYQGKLVVGGWYSEAGGVAANNIAAWDGITWTPLGTGVQDNVNGDPYVLALTELGSDLYAGGGFVSAGGGSANHVARWNGTNWFSLPHPSSGGNGVNGDVHALAAYNGKLIVGGAFSAAAGSILAGDLAQWDSTGGWSTLGTGVNDNVYKLANHAGHLIVGGGFDLAGGQPASRVARWDGSQWSAVGNGLNAEVRSIAVLDGAVVVGGDFTETGSGPANRVARLVAGEWEPLGEGMNDRVRVLVTANEYIGAGGAFNVAGTDQDAFFYAAGKDIQTDADGVPYSTECPNADACADSDGDGTPDYLDADDDGDGVPTTVECPDAGSCPDTDGDGVPDYTDPDDDGDGIPTAEECPDAGSCPDTDGDGVPDYTDPDDDGDGLPTNEECDPSCGDDDGDGTPDYLDSDPVAQEALIAHATPNAIVFGGTSALSVTGGSGSGATNYSVTSGDSFCNVAGETLTGTGIGSCTVMATKAADANYLAATATTVVTVSMAQADLRVEKIADVAQALTGSVVVYDITVTNDGPNAVSGAVLTDTPPAGLIDVAWACNAELSTAACPASSAGTGELSTSINLAAGAFIHYDFSATVHAPMDTVIENSASVSPPAGVSDPDDGNNTSTATLLVVGFELFSDGFEAGGE